MKELPLIPAMTKQSGDYTHAIEGGIDWNYSYLITAVGSRSERREGRLKTSAVDLAKAQPGDRVHTPWGTMQRMATRYEDGWLLEGTYGRPIDETQGQLFEAPAAALVRGGTWTGHVEEWRYTLLANAMGTRSERRIGRLSYGRMMVVGKNQGDSADTPWGVMHWMGKVHLEEKTDYEQGFLLRGTFDRALDELTGNVIVPTEIGACRLESLYLEGVKLDEELPGLHFVGLSLFGRPDRHSELTGTLTLDPNTCQLNAWGDREGCTRMMSKALNVQVVQQRLADPSGLHRRFFEVTGPGVPEKTALIVQGKLERCYLKLGKHLVPLFLSDSVP